MPTRHQSLSLRLLILLTVAGIVFLLISGRVDAATPATAPSDYRVSAGDTLWEIATQVARPGDDVRAVVAEIKHDNGLESSSLSVGQVLSIPSS